MLKILCDTNFYIYLLNENSLLHGNARGYFEYFTRKEFELSISTIAIAEYCVKGDLSELPLKNLKIISFNLSHAKKAGEFTRITNNARKDGHLDIDKRIIVLNDTKMFAQAECEHFDYYLTSDVNSLKIYNLIQPKFRFLDFNAPYDEVFGVLDFTKDDDLF